MTWSVDCDPDMETVVVFGRVGNPEEIDQLTALQKQIEEAKDIILEACRLYAARTANLSFPGSTDY